MFLSDVLTALTAGLALVSVLGAFTSFRKLPNNVARVLCLKVLSRSSTFGPKSNG